MAILDEVEISKQISHLFTLRLWLEDLGDGHADWRGKVLYVNNGEACYFRDWQTLEVFMERLFHEVNN